ncbi:GNAT family N-acetyltransferase [Paenibacillus radicis (ex Xue et al. 2023)]|uniref:GNAT family N-acetyltransferase n=1 Tax=Paenibacillus radicis (ex Xue et al. 2023) TaxID=2972489 RepID=A0ABT1YAC1_9BACL|nr:GNAT family N-acetyltransferase [Paenibacillus radicis (ex Xue et al. 2023)]MCR8630143.1 GNAT family N-acetyltransferase [Paenibacillus radicis (ex Xue et al. 2023)]
MLIREIEEQDNKQVEYLIRTCLVEFGANKPGTAWSDPSLGDFYNLYKNEGSKYWVVEENKKIVAGCGIGPVMGWPDICELQKMYAFKETRGTGISSELLQVALDYAKQYYEKCYLETLSNMVAANKFYKKNGFIQLEKPLNATEHFACDTWYIKTLK